MACRNQSPSDDDDLVDSAFPADCKFTIGDFVQFSVWEGNNEDVCQGEIRWMGCLPGEKFYRAGVIMKPEFGSFATTNGMLKQRRYFRCPTGKVLGRFVKLKACSEIKRKETGVAPPAYSDMKDFEEMLDDRRVFVRSIPKDYQGEGKFLELCRSIRPPTAFSSINSWSAVLRCRTEEDARKIIKIVKNKGGTAMIEMPSMIAIDGVPEDVPIPQFQKFVSELSHGARFTCERRRRPIFTIKFNDIEDVSPAATSLMNIELPAEIGHFLLQSPLDVTPRYRPL